MLEKKSFEIKLFFLTLLSLIFLSANSIFCRMALLDNSIDAYSFTFFRLFFGILTLIFLLYFFSSKNINSSISLKKGWLTPFMLFLYAISFSFSYTNMDAGIGTLILFAVVQLTMIIVALLKKENLTLKKIIGILIAFGGLAYLLYPTDDFTLSYFHTILMVISGIAWGFYSIFGKKSSDALVDTTNNFIKTIPFLLISLLFFYDNLFISSKGIWLAFFSGSITSAIGYILWYKILKEINIITASTIQLTVPIIAIFLSVLFLNEKITQTLLISTIIILLGIHMTIKEKRLNS